jgi:hypothetical protein
MSASVTRKFKKRNPTNPHYVKRPSGLKITQDDVDRAVSEFLGNGGTITKEKKRDKKVDRTLCVQPTDGIQHRGGRVYLR